MSANTHIQIFPTSRKRPIKPSQSIAIPIGTAQSGNSSLNSASKKLDKTQSKASSPGSNQLKKKSAPASSVATSQAASPASKAQPNKKAPTASPAQSGKQSLTASTLKSKHQAPKANPAQSGKQTLAASTSKSNKKAPTASPTRVKKNVASVTATDPAKPTDSTALPQHERDKAGSLASTGNSERFNLAGETLPAAERQSLDLNHSDKDIIQSLELKILQLQHQTLLIQSSLVDMGQLINLHRAKSNLPV